MKSHYLLGFVLVFAMITGCSSNEANSEKEEKKYEEKTLSSSETASSVEGAGEETEADNSSLENQDGLSEEFASYTRKFYDAVAKQSEGIQLTFALSELERSELEYEGLEYVENPSAVEETISSIETLDKLLIFYETEAKPQTETDQELYDITMEMVELRKLVNEHNIEALQDSQRIDLSRAESYLEAAINKTDEGEAKLSTSGY